MQEPTGGEVELGANVALGYFAQEHEQVDLAVTVLDNIDDTVSRPRPSDGRCSARSGSPGEAAYQMPKTLSGGERAKLGLAMLAAGKANVLLLDEPTNNLDPSSIEAVGTMLAVAGNHRGGQPRPMPSSTHSNRPTPSSSPTRSSPTGATSTSTRSR